MSAANETRRRFAKVLLALGAILLLFGAVGRSGWASFALLSGGALFATGAIMYASVSLIDGVPWLVRLFSRLSEPKWDGEILHSDGDEYKIRYLYDEDGSPRFVAQDVCVAIGVKPPAKDAVAFNGIQLLREGELAYFSEADVQAYLALRATHNHAAKRLLVRLRDDVLRKLEKRRDDARRYDQEPG